MFIVLLLLGLGLSSTDPVPDTVTGDPPVPQVPPALQKNKYGWFGHNGRLTYIEKNNLADLRRSIGAVIAGFYDPGCEPCKDFLEFMERVWDHFSDGNRFGSIAGLVNVKEEKVLAKQWEVNKVPAIIIFTDLNRFAYEGPLTLRDLDIFFHKVVYPRGREVISEANAKYIFTGCYMCALVVTPETDYRQIQWLGEAAQRHPDMSLHWAAESKTGRFEGAQGAYTLFLHREFDDGLKVLSGNETLTIQQMTEFFDSYAVRRLQDVDATSVDRILTKEESSFFLFVRNTQSEDARTFSKMAIEKLGVIWGVGVWGSEFVDSWAGFLGVRPTDPVPAVLIRFENGAMVKHRPADLSRETLGRFLDEFKTGVLPVFYKSEEGTATETGRVRRVTGKTFDEVVVDNDDHVLLLVTAKYCVHSKKAEKMFEELAERMGPVPGLVLAKMEGTENEHAGLEMKTFPLIKLYRSFDKMLPIDYDRERFVDSLREFLQRHLNTQLPLKEKSVPVSDEL